MSEFCSDFTLLATLKYVVLIYDVGVAVLIYHIWYHTVVFNTLATQVQLDDFWYWNKSVLDSVFSIHITNLNPPKSSILMGLSILDWKWWIIDIPFWDTSNLGNLHMDDEIFQPRLSLIVERISPLKVGEPGLQRSVPTALRGCSNNKPPIFDGLYQLFLVIRGMVYYCYTNITCDYL